MARNGIDIIVPVYNALEDLKLCVESIKKNTDLSLDRLILINDKSPDQNVFPYLESFSENGVIVLHNEENLGFSGTINRGMLFSGRDVLLLNSDTIVTHGWIDKIVACAYSDPAIGTVTPFSNNATLCSIPNFCEENTVPYGLSIDEYAQIIEECSMRKYPRITVAVGFCMFIKREVVDLVGLFDQETFQKGYGEENDFCWRAEQMGYYHALCDDTYIFHSGSASFISEEKKQLMDEHERILLDRYPKQIQENAEYVRDNPHQYLRTNVDIHAKLNNGKKNLLYVLHLDFFSESETNFGGTQLHVKDLTNYFRDDYNVFVLAREEKTLRLTVYQENSQMTFCFFVGKAPDFQPFHSEQITEVMEEVIKAFSIDYIHVHHISTLSFDIFDIAKKYNIPLVMTLHDFYMICPTVVLLENGKKFCNGCGENCDRCLQKEKGYYEKTQFIQQWRKACRKALQSCDLLITPSFAAKEMFASVYPETVEKIQVIPHGVAPFEKYQKRNFNKKSDGFDYWIDQAFEGDNLIRGWALANNLKNETTEVTVHIMDKNGLCYEYKTLKECRPDVSSMKGDSRYLYSGFYVRIPDCYFASGTLKLQLNLVAGEERYYSDIITVDSYAKKEKERKRIAFLGGINEIKGGALAYEMIRHDKGQFDWYIIGGIGNPDLTALDKNNLHKTGWYKRENVVSLLQQNQIDLVCLLSICPETFCYTVSEAQLAGIPMLVTDIGAQGERITNEKTGWLVHPEANAKEVFEKIESILLDDVEYLEMRRKVGQFQHRTLDEMCEDYQNVYSTLSCNGKRSLPYDSAIIYRAFLMGMGDCGENPSDMNTDLVGRVNELEQTLLKITQSLEYKMFRFINQEKFPGKKLLKRLIGSAYRIYRKLRK